MTFQFRPAKREGVPLLIGVAGGTGSGKTMSALRLAKGLAGGKKFAAVDTENGRMSHYADMFEFDVTDLRAPFRPERYADAIQAADKAGYPVVVVDSMSHEWSGDDGVLEYQEKELARMGGRESARMASWIAPKMAHRKMVTRLLQVQAHVVLCFRAAARVDMVKVDGKTQVVPKQSLVGLDGWIPITEKDLPFELTMSLLLMPDAPGMPRPIKLQQQHASFLPLDRVIGEETGVALAEWAAGSEAQDESAAELPGLITELLELADELGKRDVTTAAIGRDRQKKVNDLAAHAAWLHGQIASARKAVEKLRAEPDENLFPAADADPTPPNQED